MQKYSLYTNSIFAAREVSMNNLYKRFRQTNILYTYGSGEKRGDFPITESGNPATNSRDIEEKFRVILCKHDELVNIWGNSINPSLHRRNSIALSPEPDSASHHGAEVLECHQGRSASMEALKVRAKNEYLVRTEFRNHLRCESGTFDSCIYSYLL